MKSQWFGDKLITEHSEALDVSCKKIVDSHRFPSFGKLMGIDYDWFETTGNGKHISCAFKEKIGPLNITMKFDKEIEICNEYATILFKTNNTPANINGVWKIQKRGNDGSYVNVRHELTVPKIFKWLPIKNNVERKLQSIFESMRKL